MLRRRVLLVAAILLCSLLVLPVLNVAARLQAGKPVAWSGAGLFDTKVQAAAWIHRALYGWGISTSPEKVLVGRKGWLFLGDEYAATVTATRQGRAAQDDAAAVRIAAATRAWDAWLQQRGVKAFRIMVAPNKASVYPEYLPLWAAAAKSAPVDALFAHAAPVYLDTRAALVAAKRQAGDLLYYPTDTHWTAWGASVAFESLAGVLSRQAPDLRWPHAQARAVRALRARAGGDLANFLQLSDLLADPQPVTGLSESGRETIHYAEDVFGVAGLRGGRRDAGVRQDASTMPDIPPRAVRPVRVVSPAALNARRVLWLRDSFGAGLAPLMAATFSETLQAPWDVALRKNLLAQWVEVWRPDYVIVTVVERNALSELFALPPPGTQPVSSPAAPGP